jgi:hypothetical protein
MGNTYEEDEDDEEEQQDDAESFESDYSAAYGSMLRTGIFTGTSKLSEISTIPTENDQSEFDTEYTKAVSYS